MESDHSVYIVRLPPHEYLLRPILLVWSDSQQRYRDWSGTVTVCIRTV